MNFKGILALFGVMLFGAGFVMAIPFGATASAGTDEARWNGIDATDVTTDGGTITPVDIEGAVLTDRWAAFFGDVTGTIYLTDDTTADTSYVYSWDYDVTNGGYVCASTGDAFDFTSAALVATGAGLDGAGTFNLGTASDNGAVTFDGTDMQTLNFNNLAAVGPTACVATYDDANVATWETCLISDGATATPDDFAFCVPIATAATNAYNGEAHDYQLMVPTTPGTGTDDMDYFFYAELN